MFQSSLSVGRSFLRFRSFFHTPYLLPRSGYRYYSRRLLRLFLRHRLPPPLSFHSYALRVLRYALSRSFGSLLPMVGRYLKKERLTADFYFFLSSSGLLRAPFLFALPPPTLALIPRLPPRSSFLYDLVALGVQVRSFHSRQVSDFTLTTALRLLKCRQPFFYSFRYRSRSKKTPVITCLFSFVCEIRFGLME